MTCAAVRPTAGAGASESEVAGRSASPVAKREDPSRSPETSLSSDRKHQDKGQCALVNPKPQMSFIHRCETCRVVFRTLGLYTDHMRGERHQQNSEIRAKELKPRPRASKRKAEEQIKEHLAKRNQVFSGKDRVVLGEAGELLFSPALTSASSDFHCAICKLDFPDHASKRRHVKSKSHKRHVKMTKMTHAAEGLERHDARMEAEVTPRGEIAIKLCGGRMHTKNHTTLHGKKKRKSGACRMAVTPKYLFRMHCTISGCGCFVDMNSLADWSIAEYLWCRRQTKRFAGLLSLCLKLDSQSHNFLSGVASSLGIVSNTASIHLTLLEGIKPEYSAEWFGRMASSLEHLYKALTADSYMTVVGLRRVPRHSEEGTALIVADVSISHEAEAARGRIIKAYRVMLPQFQLHIALGACGEADVDSILNELNQHGIGQRLSLDFRSLIVLAPTTQEQRHKGEVSQAAAERQARYAKTFGPVVYKANEVASRLNNLLGSIMKRARYRSAPVLLEHKTYVRSESDAEVLAQALAYKSKIDFLCFRADTVLKEVEDALSMTNK